MPPYQEAQAAMPPSCLMSRRQQESEMSTIPQWQLMFVLPNLRLGEHERSPSEVTLGLEGIAIVPASDSRVVEIREWSEAADSFLRSFHDGYGTAITPAALIVRDDWHSGIVVNPEAVISFRNAVATASILPIRAQGQNHGCSGVLWSESFDDHPARLRPDGSKFNYRTPALNSIGFRLDSLQITPDLRVPRPHLMYADENLADRLGRAWWIRYGCKRDMQKTAKVFRSLEAAYDALGLRFTSHSSLNAVGLSTVPWTTAIEVLATPEADSVTKWDCTRLIGQHEFSAPRLRWQKYWVKPKKGGRRYMTLAQRIYLSLHEARSKFVHGDKVSVKLLLADGDGAPPLLSLASTIYRTALMAYLEGHWPARVPSAGESTSLAELLRRHVRDNHADYEGHLLNAIGKSYWD